MRRNFSTKWIFHCWITCALVIFYAQETFPRSLTCKDDEYLKNSRCCEKCPAGKRVLEHCTESQRTKCTSCNHHEYQPGLTKEMTCTKKKYCDPGKGFLERIKQDEDRTQEEPCRCRQGLQCYHINCEFCESIPTCRAGEGLELEDGSQLGRQSCAPCRRGFYSAEKNQEKCKKWTDCKAEGKTELQPGSAQKDAVCGPPPPETPSWLIIPVLSVITLLCVLILLLFCYKDKLKLLSVNLRSCVQNLKRSRIQQETLAPLYPSGAAGGGLGETHGVPNSTPCETTKLVCQAAHGPETDSPPTFTLPLVGVSRIFAEESGESEGSKLQQVIEFESQGSGEPEELSEEEVSGPRLCVCPVREPLEVGENEDCSQAVIPGTLGECSCGSFKGNKDAPERREDTSERTGERNLSPLIQTFSQKGPISPLPEHCLPQLQAAVRPQLESAFPQRPASKQEELYRPASLDSNSSSDSSSASAMTSVSALVTAGDLCPDKPTEGSGPQQGQSILCGARGGDKLPLEESELESSPESLHSQLTEPTLTSGLVSGSHNTTFISSGQVMNVTGDVIVVYVSQTSSSGEEGAQENVYGSPVQEEANETRSSLQSNQRQERGFRSIHTFQEETLPVQEKIECDLLGK